MSVVSEEKSTVGRTDKRKTYEDSGNGSRLREVPEGSVLTGSFDAEGTKTASIAPTKSRKGSSVDEPIPHLSESQGVLVDADTIEQAAPIPSTSQIGLGKDSGAGKPKSSKKEAIYARFRSLISAIQCGLGLVNIVARLVLVTANLLVLLVSLVIIGGAIYSTSLYQDFPPKYQKDLVEKLTDMGWFETPDGNRKPQGEFTLSDIIHPNILINGLVIIGCIIFILSFLGLSGGCGDNCMLCTYIVVSFLLWTIEISAVADFKKSWVAQYAKPMMQRTLRNYSGIRGTDLTTQLWTSLMIREECCGVDSYRDFTKGGIWAGDARDGTLQLVTPIACCKKFPAKSDDCAKRQKATPKNNNMEIGCFDKVYAWFKRKDDGSILKIAIIIIVLQVLLVLLAMFILIIAKCCEKSGDKVEESVGSKKMARAKNQLKKFVTKSKSRFK